jgi:hypothetical protein
LAVPPNLETEREEGLTDKVKFGAGVGVCAETDEPENRPRLSRPSKSAAEPNESASTSRRVKKAEREFRDGLIFGGGWRATGVARFQHDSNAVECCHLTFLSRSNGRPVGTK